jgi:hypothetical protein
MALRSHERRGRIRYAYGFGSCENSFHKGFLVEERLRGDRAGISGIMSYSYHIVYGGVVIKPNVYNIA